MESNIGRLQAYHLEPCTTVYKSETGVSNFHSGLKKSMGSHRFWPEMGNGVQGSDRGHAAPPPKK